MGCGIETIPLTLNKYVIVDMYDLSLCMVVLVTLSNS